MKPARLALVVGLVLAASRDAGAQGVPAEEFVVIPLRVHVLRSPEIAMANGRLTEAEVAVIAGRSTRRMSRAIGTMCAVRAVTRRRDLARKARQPANIAIETRDGPRAKGPRAKRISMQSRLIATMLAPRAALAPEA